MRLVTAACATLAIVAVGCSSPMTIRENGVAETVPRMVWIPEWGIHLREGVDVVRVYGRYYRYVGGRWNVSQSPAGPWVTLEGSVDARVTRPPGPVAIPLIPPHTRPRPRDERAPHTDPVVAEALRHVGTPYVWGGTTPSGFDCSGFVQYVFGAVGVTLPRSVAQQYRHGVPIARQGLRPGDIVFFDRLRHNAIYIGEGRIVHAARSDKSVEIGHLNDAWFERRWVGARRMPLENLSAHRD